MDMSSGKRWGRMKLKITTANTKPFIHCLIVLQHDENVTLVLGYGVSITSYAIVKPPTNLILHAEVAI